MTVCVMIAGSFVLECTLVGGPPKMNLNATMMKHWMHAKCSKHSQKAPIGGQGVARISPSFEHHLPNTGV